MTHKRFLATIAALCLVAAAFAAPASAERGEKGERGERGGGHGKDKVRPGQTRMRFKLDDHQLALGEPATGEVTLQTRVGKQWEPLAGATLSILMDGGNTDVVGLDECVVTETEDCIVIDGSDCLTAVTDVQGHAVASCTATAEGEYVMRVRYTGDATHKKAQRAQGFTVGGAEEEDELPVPDPSATPPTI